MSFDRAFLNPTVETHVPVTVHIPEEENILTVGRPDIPPPSLWQKSVQVKHKVTGKVAIVARIDWSTNMFRAFYPDEGEPGEDGRPAGRFSERTEWQQCADWDVSVTFSPKELEKQAAQRQLDDEVAKLDQTSLEAMMVLVDGDDPAKALAKLKVLRSLGVIKAAPEVAQAAMQVPPEVRDGNTARRENQAKR